MKHQILIACSMLWLSFTVASAQSPKMTAHFVDVGQAEAVLLEFPCAAVLVDAGSDEEHPDALVSYLNQFFQSRPSLNRTLELVIITHSHKDHTQSLRAVIDSFTVKRYVDNGFTSGSGVANPNWLKGEVAAGRLNITVREIAESQVESVPGHTGLTNSVIDPINCGTIDPRIRILTGSRLDANPGWPEGDFDNQNNHSLVTRVDFGQASFLFMGDLEKRGIETLLGFYGTNAAILDADVLQVGHHGSDNATTAALLTAVSPNVAVIPVGPWTFGQSTNSKFTTFAYGHPRKDAVISLQQSIARMRPQTKSVMVGTGQFQFSKTTMRKAVYATGWDGTVRVIARSNGTFTVYREH